MLWLVLPRIRKTSWCVRRTRWAKLFSTTRLHTLSYSYGSLYCVSEIFTDMRFYYKWHMAVTVRNMCRKHTCKVDKVILIFSNKSHIDINYNDFPCTYEYQWSEHYKQWLEGYSRSVLIIFSPKMAAHEHQTSQAIAYDLRGRLALIQSEPAFEPHDCRNSKFVLTLHVVRYLCACQQIRLFWSCLHQNKLW